MLGTDHPEVQTSPGEGRESNRTHLKRGIGRPWKARGGFPRIPTALSLVIIWIVATTTPSAIAQSDAPDAAASSFGDSPSPEDIIDLNDGIYLYLQGYRDLDEPTHYLRAIERFSAVLSRDANNQAALLFRALCYGRIGLFERARRIDQDNSVASYRLLLESRDDPEQLEQIVQEMEQLRTRMEAPSLTPPQQLLLEARLNQLDQLQFLLEGNKDATREGLQAAIEDYRTQSRQTAEREKKAFVAMTADLERLNAVIGEPGLEIQLLDVVATSKVAKLDSERARDIRSGLVRSEARRDSPARLRQKAQEALDRTSRILERLLSQDLSGLKAVRVRFFLGVIKYRQAVPLLAETEKPRIDVRLLSEAEQLMRDLVDDPSTPRQWKSYAALYLGIILPFRASKAADATERERLFDHAEEFLDLAVELDTQVVDPSQPPTSASGGPIPDIVIKQKNDIAKIRSQPAVAAYQNDFQLSMFFGLNRDTNVVLLGERTDLPRGVSKQSDYGFNLGLAANYTYNLGNWDSRYDRWTVGVQARTTQLWHAEIDPFDEQTYGITAAVQYEAMPKQDRFGPVYVRLQYDFAWTNLGRESFLGSNTIRPDVRWYWDDRRGESSLYVSYENRDYFEPLFDKRFDRTGNYVRFGMTQNYKLFDLGPVYESWGLPPWGRESDVGLEQDDPDFPRRYFTPFVGLEYGYDSTVGDEFDQKNFTLALGFALPLPYGFTMDAGAEFEWEDYSRGSLVDFHRRSRRDFIQEYEIGVSRTYVLQAGELANRYTPTMDRSLMTVRCHARWTDDDSNVVDRLGQAIFSYDRVFYGITVAFSLN